MAPNFQESKFSNSKSLARVIWRVYFSFAILGGILALYLLFQRRSESQVFLLGLSSSRLLLAVIILIATFAFGWLLLQSWLHPQWVEERLDRLASVLSRPSRWCTILLVTGLLFLAGSYFLTLVPEITEPFTRAYFVRLLPLVAWVTGLSALTLVALPILRYGSGFLEQRPRSKLFYTSLVIFIILFFAWWWVSQTNLELEARRTGWNSLAAPILETQILIAWLAGMFTLALLTIIEKRSSQHNWLLWLKPQRIDLFIGLILWVISIILWVNVPTHSNWFVSEQRPPNFEHYPSSDAFVYDSSAQFLLVGEGFKSWTEPYVRRPLHTLYLTALHLVAGQKYDSVVFLQIIILALLPVFMYYLVKALYSRSAGVIAALLIILREVNSISIAGNITTSNVKLLMSDLPATIAVVGFVLIVITWLQNIEQNQFYPLIAGGALGIPVLIRFETAILVLPLGVVTALLFGLRKNLRFWLKNMLLFILGLMLVLTPWIWRNWKATGLLFIDSPTHSFDLISLRYLQAADTTKVWLPLVVDIKNTGLTTQPSPATPISPPISKPEESIIPSTPSVILKPTSRPPDTDGQRTEFIISTSQQAVDLFKSNPSLYSSVFMTHYLNSQIQTMLVLPTSFRAFDSLMGFLGHKSLSTLRYECCSVTDYTRRMPYWRKWDGAIPREALIPLIINLLLMATGLSVAWKRNKLVGIIPLIFAFTYILGNALFRNSGGRYILPVDWISIPYFSIGLAHLSKKCVSNITKIDLAKSLDYLSTSPPAPSSPKEVSLLRSPKFYAISISLLLFGSLLPIAEVVFKPKYSMDQKDKLVTSLMQSNLLSEGERLALETFYTTHGEAIVGRALYPRFFPANVGEIWSDNVFGPQPYTRVGFLLAGPESRAILMPLQERPNYFPNASDVVVFNCPGPEMDALLVAILDDSGSPVSILWRSPLPSSFTCPLPAIESPSSKESNSGVN